MESIFFDFGSDSSTEFGANKSVKEIATKNNGEGVLVGLDDQGECGNDEKEARDGTLGAPIQSFKAGVAHLTKHHKTQKKEQGGQKIIKISDHSV